ncbi:hypothetical protein QJQ45_006706 [Haematococcus lacustris]|nr:hypothetical protein QJQ45_006706 [Haematococcus lacustris]
MKAAIEDIASLLAQHSGELCLAKPETETPCDTRSWEAANEVVQHAERMLQQQQEGQQQKRTGQRLPMCDPRVWDVHGTWEKHGKQIRAIAKDHALSEQADKRAFQFDPVTQMGMGLDPGAIQAGNAALGMWDEDGCLKSFHISKLTRSQVQHDSGLIQARRSTQLWNDNMGNDNRAKDWVEEYATPSKLSGWKHMIRGWVGGQGCPAGLPQAKPSRSEGWKPKPGQVQHRLLRSAWSKRFESPVRGLMWCPKLDQATPGDVGRWVDRDCNAALNI